MPQNVKAYKLIEQTIPKERVHKGGMIFFAICALLLPAIFILFLSERPTYSLYDKDVSLIKFTIKYPSKHESKGRELTEKETETKLKHMRKTNSPFAQIRMEYERERLPVYVEVDLDNENVLSKTYYPTGLRKDGPTFAYEEIPVTPGQHEIKIRMRDVDIEEAVKHIKEKEEPILSGYTFEKIVNLKAGEITVIDFDREDKIFYILGQEEEEEDEEEVDE